MRYTLALLVALAGCRAAEPPVLDADVRRVDVEIALDPVMLRIEGRTALVVAHGGAAGPLALGLDDAMTVEGVRVGGRAAPFEHEGGALRISLAAADSSRVEVVYGGVPERGLYAGSTAGQRVVFTDGWPDRAAGWLPMVHHPSDPVAFSLAVVVPRPWEVVASGAPAGTDTLTDGRVRYCFRLAAGVPAYTVAFAAADFTTVEDTTGPVPIRHHLLAADAAEAADLARTPAVLDALEDVLGPYPFASYATVQVPLQWAGMENAAAPFLRADYYRAEAHGRPAIEEVNVHEAAHQWFGNRVVPADWRDLWLAEGAATYLTSVVYERLDGPTAARQARVRMAQMEPGDARRALVPDRLDEPADALSPTVYGKGGCVFHLLRLRLGDAAFFGALRRLAQADDAPRVLSTAGFQTALEEASGRDLDAFFAFWVYGTRVPTLRTTWDAEGKTLRWRVESDEGTLAGQGFELLVRQGAWDRYVSARDGSARLPGYEQPEVYPVGVPLRVRG